MGGLEGKVTNYKAPEVYVFSLFLCTFHQLSANQKSVYSKNVSFVQSCYVNCP